jgi:hypothetical protein
MRPSDDPFDARPTAELLATDALLDRVGARTPTPDDLDDPLIAALALMAAEIDLDAPAVEVTRAALADTLPDLGAPGAGPSAGLERDESTGLVIDLRDSAVGRTARRDATGTVRRRPPQPERTAPPVAMAPPRSLPRMPPPRGSAGSRSPRRRERRMRPMMAVAVALIAIVVGSGASAAITGGRSVNPLDGIQEVVAVLTHGRTDDQTKAYEDVNRRLDAAEKAADKHQDAAARAMLADIGDSLLQKLDDEDHAAALARIEDIKKKIGH